MRKNIFDIMSERINVSDDVDRIINIASKEKTLCVNGYMSYTLFDFVDKYCFKNWDFRNHCVDIKDFFNVVGMKK